MSTGEGPAGGRSLEDALRALTDEQRASDAVAERRRERDLRRQAAESGTLPDALRDLGERAVSVAVTTASGRTVSGTIRTVGADFVGLQSVSGTPVMVALSAVELLRPAPDAPATVGDDRALVVRAGMAGVLAELATDRLEVTVHVRSGDRVAGRLQSVGTDLVAVAADDGSVAYVPLAAVAEVALS